MLPGRIDGANLRLTPPENFRESCWDLFVRFNGDTFTSAWFPSAEEAQRILDGAPIYLKIAGDSHPPVALYVGDPPK